MCVCVTVYKDSNVYEYVCIFFTSQCPSECDSSCALIHKLLQGYLCINIKLNQSIFVKMTVYFQRKFNSSKAQ